MADLVSKVLEELISFTAREMKQEVTLVVGVKKEVEKLTSNFQAINAVLDDAEEKQFKEATIKHWLDKLKDVSYDMDDVMDEWSTAIQKSQEVDEHPPKPKRKVCSFISSSWFRCGEVSLRHDIARKIKKLNERLDDIAKEKSNYYFEIGRGTKPFEREKTISIIDVSIVRGRGTEKDILINKLLSESSQEPNPHVISIVGMGGMGKTTLAQLAYNDNRVKAHFEKRIWVCVSDPFDEIRVAKAILESLTGSSQNLVELEILMHKIQESIDGKKFLLVLDDVWEEDSRKWKHLSDSLRHGLLGSKILVTTRKENVAGMMGCTRSNRIPLGQLSMDECWSLFSQFAFFEWSNAERESLEDIGKEIVAKCKGLPLAVKTLGSLLRSKKSREEWQSVLDSYVWELKEAKKDLFGPLWLSYIDLPSEMRSCFSYCAMFRKDHEWEKDELIEIWMAQGYLRSSQNIELEMVGHQYFETLAARSFFQDFVKDEDDGSIIRCKMHDIVHDFAQYVTKNECVSIEFNGLKEPRMGSSSKGPRHSMIVSANEDQLPMSSYHFKKLHSLVVKSRSVGAILPELFSKLTCLRMLNLSSCAIEVVPSSIRKLIHLRYINLSWNSIKELPETICELYNLQTLDVAYCDNLRGLPCGIGKLLNLRHLKIQNAVECFIMEGIKRLSSLRTLDWFVVNGSGGHDGEASNLGDLENLNNLRGHLGIDGLGDVRNPDDARQANLKSKIHLNSLYLEFDAWRTEKGVVCDDEVIGALEPSPNLEKLVIWASGSMTRFPNWITSLSKLKRITLAHCDNIMYLPPLGKLLCLEVIVVHGMKGVKRVGEEFLGIKNDGSRSTKKDKGEMSSSPDINIAFPKLKKLKFWDMEEWEEWGDEEINNKTTNISNIMPSLRSLSIFHCPKLKALPGYLFHLKTLEELTIGGCPILEKRFKKGEGEDWHNISHIPNIHITESINIQD